MNWSIEFTGLDVNLDTKVDPQGKSDPFEVECFEDNTIKFMKRWKELSEESQ